MKTLILDIEKAPKVALVWKFFKENISPKQVLEHGHIISFAAKWLNEDNIIYHENRKNDDKIIIKHLVNLLDEADFVVAHYGSKFDLPQIRGRALVNNIPPPSPVKVIDTLTVAQKQFGFASNSLEYLSMVLGCKRQKTGHKKFPGFELWLECLRNNEEAWKELREYNINDVLVLEEVYLAMRPWMPNHPNVSIEANNQAPTCPKCGSVHLHSRGYYHTNTASYRRYQCQDCCGWSKSRYRLNEKNENLLFGV